jgi:hypothetical protein
LRDFFTPALAVLVTVTLIGSIGATTLILQQQASAIVIEGSKDFKKLSKQFQRDVLSLMTIPPPDGDKLAKLFQDYEQAMFRIFGLTPR